MKQAALSGIRRLENVFEASCDAHPNALALVCGEQELSYTVLDGLSNQLGHFLVALGIGPGGRVATLMERSVAGYAAHLAIFKAGAALVPMDLATPCERARFITGDASVDLVLHSSRGRELAQSLSCPTLDVDELIGAGALADQPAQRIRRPVWNHPLCYIIYTSGSTGTPKGVAVSHANICNYLRVVPTIYGVSRADRVCQVMTVAFDFAMEEIWVTWAAGATLVAAPTDSNRLGAGLVDFLHRQRVTVLCAVPTLLATLDDDAPLIRTLIVGGEHCPPELVRRWARPGRRMLNTYGPTETTITATWKELRPNEPVTIGRALPTYRVYVMDDELRPVNQGDTGEICIGGPGVAMGYVNCPQLQQQRFVPDPLGATDERLYRSGDIGRETPLGDIEILGRTDGEVKIRGYRVNVAEVEAVLRTERRVLGAAVVAYDPGYGAPLELIAYVVAAEAGPVTELVRVLHLYVRRHLPPYMFPASIEILDRLPTSASGKIDRSALPAPVGRPIDWASKTYVAPTSGLEAEVAEIWADVLGCGRISVDADFFDELGGHSLLAATVVSRLRQSPAHVGLSIADLYSRPTIRGLTQILETLSATSTVPAEDHRFELPRRPRLRGITFLQVSTLYVMVLIASAPVAWLVAVSQPGEWMSTLLRASLLLPCVVTAVSFLLPVIGLRLAAVGLRPGRYPLWSGAYFRWWVCRKLLAMSPLRVLSGSPFAAPYLRLLGARVGRDCHLGTARFDLPFLIDVGDRANVGYGTVIQPYVVEDGWLSLDLVTIGADSFVGANSLILSGGRVGPQATVMEHSLIGAGVVVPRGETWSGSPAVATSDRDEGLELIESADLAGKWTSPQRAAFMTGIGLLSLLPYLTLVVPAAIIAWAVSRGSVVAGLAATIVAGPMQVLAACALIGLAHRVIAPRSASGIFAAQSGMGLRKWAGDKLMESSLSLTNALFGTLYTPAWLRFLGADVGRRAEVSTVSNIDPHLLHIGPETFVADQASIGGARHHRGMIAVAPTVLERRSFVGNGALVLAGTRLGAGCLIGVHTPCPAGAVGPATTWLGSPPISLPRREVVEGIPDELTYTPSRGRVIGRLAIEYLRVTLPATIATLVSLVAILVQFRLAALVPPPVLVALTPLLVIAAGLATFLAVAVLKWVVIGRYRPRVEPLWSWFVRRTELITGAYEALAVPAFLGWMTGTALIGPLLRILGADVGRDVWLETTFLSEFDLVHVSDGACIGELTSLQTHLFEDRVMKMSHVSVGHRTSIGSRSVLLYDCEVGDFSTLDGLSLVMKGERLTARRRWCGIPARSTSSTTARLAEPCPPLDRPAALNHAGSLGAHHATGD